MIILNFIFIGNHKIEVSLSLKLEKVLRSYAGHILGNTDANL